MKKLHGVTAAMITPLTSSNKVNKGALRDLTDFLIDKGVNCLYPLGTTGEMYRLTTAERKETAEIIVEQAEGRVPVFIHVGAINMGDTLQLAKHAYEIGADGIGVVTPSYFKVNDKEMEEYFVTVAREVPEDFPMYLYNIPQCSGNDLTTKIVERIVKQCPNVVGIKYSFPDFLRTLEYLNVNDGNFSVLHGADKWFYGLLTMGCSGTVSGVACVYPEPFVAIYKAFQENDQLKAQQIQKIANRYSDVLKNGSNMAYFKAALEMRGIEAGYMRRPQLDLTEEEKKQLKKDLDSLNKIVI